MNRNLSGPQFSNRWDDPSVALPSSYAAPEEGYYRRFHDLGEDDDLVHPEIEEQEDKSEVLWARNTGGGALGYLHVDRARERPKIRMVETNPRASRSGVATWMMEAGESLMGLDYDEVDTDFTPEGAEFWRKYTGKPALSNTEIT